ncbi:UNVERIFIED_CONTAM: magnesium-transporting ATPase (P-type) [Paenibacillus sp. PvR008]
MTIMKQAWMITRQDFRNNPYVMLWTLLFIMYLGVTMSFVVSMQLGESGALNPAADFVMVVLIPFLGYIYNRRAFKYLQEDSYTHMLAFLRILPIPVSAVIMSRIQQAVLAFIVNSVVFFILLFTFSGTLRVYEGTGFFVSFALTWIGYGMLIHAIYIHLEFLKKGTAYFWLSLVIMLVCGIIATVVRIYGVNLVSTTAYFSKKWQLLSPVMWGALAAGAIGMFVSYRMTLRRLLKRDLA